MATAGFANHLEIVAKAISDIETLEGFPKSDVVDAKISALLGTAVSHAQKAYFLLDASPVSSHIAKGIMDHLANMTALYGKARV